LRRVQLLIRDEQSLVQWVTKKIVLGIAVWGFIFLMTCLDTDGALHAQESKPQTINLSEGKKIGLIEILKIALDNNSSIQIQSEVVAASKGSLQVQGGTFDPSVSATLGGSRSGTPMFQTTVARAFWDNELTTSASLSKKFRSGITVGPSISVISNRTNSQKRSKYGAENRTKMALTLNLPLMKGASEKAVISGEESARHTVKASQYDLRHQISLTLKNAANAYWAFRFAEDVLNARRDSEARAQQFGEDMRKLIAADERPASNINLALANLSEKRVNRITAEQSLHSARTSLSNVLGIEFDILRKIVGTLNDFPQHANQAGPIIDRTNLVALARDNRWDFKGAVERTRSADSLMLGARDGMLSQLDMDFSLGYSGVHEGPRPFKTLGNHNQGFNIGATINYSFPVGKNAVSGALKTTGATLNQHRIAQRNLRNSIDNNVDNAISAYNNAILQLIEAQKAVNLYTITVQNKLQELKLGQATLLDVLTVEDQLQAAIITRLSQSSNLATSIANLQFETGRLVDDEKNISINQFLSYVAY
jgi:outer membrane protein TolC